MLFQKNKLKKLEERKTNIKKNVLLLTAHPDDETMFFLPLVKYLLKENYNLHVLCLTFGQLQNDISSSKRKAEFEKVMNNLNIKKYEILNLEKEGLYDSNKTQWDNKITNKYCTEYINKQKINVVFSFDQYGVSGHNNHIALYNFLHAFKQNTENKNNEIIKLYVLESVNILRKYFIPVDITVLLMKEFINVLYLSILGKELFDSFIFLNFEFFSSWKLMAIYKSQFLWFRKLWVIFSRYNYINTFKRLI